MDMHAPIYIHIYSYTPLRPCYTCTYVVGALQLLYLALASGWNGRLCLPVVSLLDSFYYECKRHLKYVVDWTRHP